MNRAPGVVAHFRVCTIIGRGNDIMNDLVYMLRQFPRLFKVFVKSGYFRHFFVWLMSCQTLMMTLTLDYR